MAAECEHPVTAEPQHRRHPPDSDLGLSYDVRVLQIGE